jgi:hypothetical protein
MEISRRHLQVQELQERVDAALQQGLETGEAKRVYNPDDVVIVVDGRVIEGYADDKLKFTEPNDYYVNRQEEQRRLANALEGSTRNQRRVAMKRAKKAAQKAK